jgi:Flp pilus assembly protein TadD
MGSLLTSSRLLTWGSLIAFVSLALLCYAPSMSGGFIYDDVIEIERNPNVHTLTPLTTPLFKSHELPVRPIPYLTFALNYAAHKNATWGYHLVNVLLHAINAWIIYLILYLILKRMKLPDSYVVQNISFIIAALWLVHPLHTQAVSYIYQRIELSWSFCFLMTLYFFLRGAETTGAWRWTLWIMSIVFCALGMLCKEVMVVAPLLLLAFDRCLLGGRWSDWMKQRGLLFIAYAMTWIVLWGIVTQQQGIYAEHSQTMPSRFEYLLTEFPVLCRYLTLIFWPASLNFSYGWPITTNISAVIIPLTVIIGLLIGIGVLLRRAPAYGLWGVWAVLILAPTSSIQPVLEPAAEYRMYLPLLGVIVLVVLGCVRYCSQHRLPIKPLGVMCLLLLIALGYITWQRNQLYGDPVKLWEDTASKSPHNYTPFEKLATAYSQRGDYSNTEKHARRAVEINPQDAQSWNNLGLALSKLGHPPEAVAALEKAISLDATKAPPYLNLGNVYRNQDPQQSITFYRKALQIDPDYAEASNNLAMILARDPAQYTEAFSLYEHSLRINPDNPEAHNNFALLLARMNRIPEAIYHLQLALQLKPDFAQAAQNLRILQQPR